MRKKSEERIQEEGVRRKSKEGEGWEALFIYLFVYTT